METLTAIDSAREIENDGSLARLYDLLDEEVKTLDKRFRAFSG